VPLPAQPDLRLGQLYGGASGRTERSQHQSTGLGEPHAQHFRHADGAQYGNDELSTRLSGLGSELLKQVAYDGADFSQSVQQLPAGAASDTYALQVSPAKISQHGLGDNQISLSITTTSGIKVDLKLDASDGSIAVEAHSSGKLNEVERKALGKLSKRSRNPSMA
jgi:hypothetical protein